MTDNAISIVYSDMRVPIEPVSRWPVKRQDKTLEARSTCWGGAVRRWDKVINQSEYDFSSGFFFSLFLHSPETVFEV